MVTRRQRGLSPCSYTRKVQGSHQRRHHLQYCGEGQRGRFLKIPLILNLIFHSRCEYSFDKNLPSDHRGIAKFVSNSELRHPHDLEENRKSKVEQGAPTSSCLGHRGSSWEEVGDGDLTELTWVRILQPSFQYHSLVQSYETASQDQFLLPSPTRLKNCWKWIGVGGSIRPEQVTCDSSVRLKLTISFSRLHMLIIVGTLKVASL